MRSALSPIHADAVDVQDLRIPATRIGVKPKFSAAIGLPPTELHDPIEILLTQKFSY
jgi:hypothetical protein